MSIRESLRLSRLFPLLLLVLLLFAAAMAAAGTMVAGSKIRIGAGKGKFTFVDKRGNVRKKIPVYTYVPEDVDPRTAPILFVMHGHHRSAKKYRNNWAKHADKYGFMVFAPLFTEKQWGHGKYSYASVFDRHGKMRDPSLWSYTVIEHLFDAIKAATGNAQPRYMIFGFSEGGQFVHRLVLLLPNARYSKAVVGSPGWYTMPKFDVKYPYGLGGAPASPASLRRSLGRDVVILLGDQDTDPNHSELRKTRKAMAQGKNRFSRGKKFYKEAKRRAGKLRTPFRWRIRKVHGAEHRPNQVSAAAAAIFMNR